MIFNIACRNRFMYEEAIRLLYFDGSNSHAFQDVTTSFKYYRGLAYQLPYDSRVAIFTATSTTPNDTRELQGRKGPKISAIRRRSV